MNEIGKGMMCDVSLNEVSTPYECEGYRLPTEAEWEYAIRAGTTTAFYNGDITYKGCSPLDPNLDLIGWYCGNSEETTYPVALKEPNAWRLYDMSGNVAEWVWDWFTSDIEKDTIDPTGPPHSSLNKKVCRGGSWDWKPHWCRSAARIVAPPGARFESIGFRPVRTAP
jgi:formylglycine-generating enzyme required for sulfatase activity